MDEVSFSLGVISLQRILDKITSCRPTEQRDHVVVASSRGHVILG